MAPARAEGRGGGLRRTRVVLDTSVFVNPEVRAALGRTPTEALNAFLAAAAELPSHEFFMPPSVFEELMNFVDRKRLPRELLVRLVLRPPSRYEQQVPALFLYELIEDMRDRVNRGLRHAESAVRSNGRAGADEIIRDLRRKYREALREGIIDSREDVDLILLAREIDALLVTADRGALLWAEKLGIPWLLPEKFKDYLDACRAAAGSGMPENTGI